jgi:hypothetical protein
VIPSRSLHRLAPLVCPHLVAFVKQGYHLSHCPNFRPPPHRLLRNADLTFLKESQVLRIPAEK